MKHSRLPALVLLVMALQLLFLNSSNAAGQLSVIVSTDKQSYGPGELITIDGMVKDETNQAVAFASVSIQVNDPGGNPIHLTSVLSGVDGYFSLINSRCLLDQSMEDTQCSPRPLNRGTRKLATRRLTQSCRNFQFQTCCG